VEIIMPHNGYCIKGIRSGDRLRLHLRQKHVQLGNCEFKRRSDGMWVSVKNRMKVSADDVQSVLTVYCSLMALMSHSYDGAEEAPSQSYIEPAKELRRPENKKEYNKPRNRMTYILRNANGQIRAIPKGSHASPTGIFTVRGHYRHYRNGKVIWIDEYRKGTGKKKAKTYKVGGKEQ